MLGFLGKRVEGTSQKEIAEKIGVSQQHLCDVLKGRRAPAGKVLDFLGYEDVGKRYQLKAVKR